MEMSAGMRPPGPDVGEVVDGGGLDEAVRLAATPEAITALVIGALSVLLPRDFVMGRVVAEGWSGRPLAARIAVVALVPLAAIAVAAGSFSPFLYFQF